MNRFAALPTFLSLLGITFGIFCIISVLATISSMKTAVQNDIKSLGTNTVFIDKWEYRNDWRCEDISVLPRAYRDAK